MCIILLLPYIPVTSTSIFQTYPVSTSPPATSQWLPHHGSGKPGVVPYQCILREGDQLHHLDSLDIIHLAPSGQFPLFLPAISSPPHLRPVLHYPAPGLPLLLVLRPSVYLLPSLGLSEALPGLLCHPQRVPLLV